MNDEKRILLGEAFDLMTISTITVNNKGYYGRDEVLALLDLIVINK